jgi:hypothetical protein
MANSLIVHLDTLVFRQNAGNYVSFVLAAESLLERISKHVPHSLCLPVLGACSVVSQRLRANHDTAEQPAYHHGLTSHDRHHDGSSYRYRDTGNFNG